MSEGKPITSTPYAKRSSSSGTLPGPALLQHLTGGHRASIPKVWASRAARTPDAIFLHFEGRSWTYAGAWQTIGKAAGLFSQFTAGHPEWRIGSYLANCPEALWTWFGAHRAHRVYVALNRAHRRRLLLEMIEQARVSILVTDQEALLELPDLRPHGVSMALIVDSSSGSEGQALEGKHAQSIEVMRFSTVPLGASEYEGLMPAPEDVATIMYTSGTTGRSKAARLPHDMFCRGGARFAEAVGLTAQDVVHQWFPLYHIAGQLHMTMGCILAGGALSLQRTFSASRFWEQVKAQRCTFFGALPHVIPILLQQESAPQRTQHTLRAGIVPRPPREVEQAFVQRFGVQLFDSYGMTEAEPLTLPPQRGATPEGSCGLANPDFELRIADDSGRVLGPDQRGELVVRARMPGLMMQGYENEPQPSAQLGTDGWFHTGDLAQIDADGYVYIAGRIKHVIRRRGENISAWELESLICGHPAVAECAAVGVPAALGEEDVKVVVVLRHGMALEAGQLHDWCAARMARFMVPRYIEVCAELSRTDVGKVAKELLRGIGPGVWDSEKSGTIPSPGPESRPLEASDCNG